GAVLLDDVEAVLDRTLLSDFSRDRVALGPLGRHTAVGTQRATGVGLLAVLGHALRVGHVDHANRPLEQGSDVLLAGLTAVCLDVLDALQRVGTVAVSAPPVAPAVR